MKKNKMLLAGAIIGVALVSGAVTYATTANHFQTQPVGTVLTNSPKNINEDGSFTLTNGKIQKEGDKKAEHFDWYVDPFCPDCIRVHEGTHEEVSKALKDGKVQITFHPLNFLSHKSGEYSLVVSAWTAGLADVSQDSEKVYNFMTKIWNLDTRDEQKNLTGVSLQEKLTKLSDEVGFSKEEVKEVSDNLKGYEFAINQASVNIRRMDKFKEISPKEDQSFFVPFVYGKDGKAIDGEAPDADKQIISKITGKEHTTKENPLSITPCTEECK